MDVDMIKSSASTALDLHHHHDHHQHHHNLDVFTIMMQMEKPTTTNTSPDHHQHQHQQQQLICDPNYQTTSIVPLPSNNNSSSFLDINSFSDSHSPPSNSFMGLMNSTNNNPNPNPNSTIQEPIMMSTNGGILSGRVFKGNMGIGAMAASGGGGGGGGGCGPYEKRSGSMAAMREMIFRIAAMQPIHIDPEAIKPPKRRNVRISKDPQSVAARHRRERISERIRILQRLVPGGTKMDTASMLDEAIHYVKFLKKQVQTLEQAGAAARPPGGGAGLFAAPLGAAGSGANNANYSGFLKAANCLQPNVVVSNSPMVESLRMLR